MTFQHIAGMYLQWLLHRHHCDILLEKATDQAGRLHAYLLALHKVYNPKHVNCFLGTMLWTELTVKVEYT